MVWTKLSGPLLVAVASQTLSLAQAKGIRGCPTPTKGFKSKEQGLDVLDVAFATTSEEEVALYWINFNGLEQYEGSLTLTEGLSQNTHPGHAFRAYTQNEKEEDRTLLLEYRVGKERTQRVDVAVRMECLSEANRRKYAGEEGVEERAAAAAARAEAMEALVVSPSQEGGELPPCEPEGQSHLWSCIRRVPRNDCEARHQNVSKVTEGSSFGFDKKQGRWIVGSYEDEQYNWQIPKIPKLSSGPGFLLLNMTEPIRRELLPWFEESWSQQKGVVVEQPVPGGYLNDQWVPSSLVTVFKNRKLTGVVEREMHDVLQWWTGMELRHTATFGVRVYHRGNVLLNHVDRYDTHLASAILQVHQQVDHNAGWPVEVLSEGRDCYEVYLQAGQMVLYEGAHFKHGRPMAFRGKDFANLFVHFAPRDWHGPDMNEL